jgi:hypothetical protein
MLGSGAGEEPSENMVTEREPRETEKRNWRRIKKDEGLERDRNEELRQKRSDDS